MKNSILFITFLLFANFTFGQDWEGIIVPPSPGSGMIWELQEDTSDDFNYTSTPTTTVDTINDKWINFYHNAWAGPAPTVWKRDHIFADDGVMKVITDRVEGDSVTIDGQKLARTNLGCAHSTTRIQYPVYIETSVKIMKSVLASNVWLLSEDDTQEIDICEAYGSDRWTNSFFSNKRLHLSHHVFIRQPFTDWQPSDAGSFYTNDTTVWSDDFHRIGVYWKDPVNLEYYVDGELVRTRSGMEEIDPVFHTNEIDFGDPTNDTRTGLSKPMDIIINTEDQTWRALQGLTPNDDELDNPEDNTFEVDWVRIYKPIVGEVGPVVSVTLNPDEVNTYPGNEVQVTAAIEPYNALDLSVVWESTNPAVASVNEDGLVSCLTEGTAQIIVTTNENNQKDTCFVTISGQGPNLQFVDEESYLNTDYTVGDELTVSCNFHAGTGNTIMSSGGEGIKFWLREITPGWGVANDYIAVDPSAVGQEFGTATGVISLVGVPTTEQLPANNFYFLYMTFINSAGESVDLGTYPINILSSTATRNLSGKNALSVYPNPAQSLLNIKTDNLTANEFTLQLYSVSGQLLLTNKYEQNRNDLQVDIRDLPKGFFILKLTTDEVLISSFLKN